jgi:hypothetical protein
MSQVSLKDLRQVAESLAALRGRVVAGAVMRSDLRQLRIELDDGSLAVIGVLIDDDGRPRLEVDVVRHADAPAPQLEVRFESA